MPQTRPVISSTRVLVSSTEYLGTSYNAKRPPCPARTRNAAAGANQTAAGEPQCHELWRRQRLQAAARNSPAQGCPCAACAAGGGHETTAHGSPFDTGTAGQQLPYTKYIRNILRTDYGYLCLLCAGEWGLQDTDEKVVRTQQRPGTCLSNTATFYFTFPQ